MPLKPTGKTDDVFATELKKKMEANAAKKQQVELDMRGASIKEIMASVSEKLAAATDQMIDPSGKTDMNKSPETKLEEQRDEKGQEPPIVTHEIQLDEPIANRKGDPSEELMEGQLRKHELKHAPNKDLEGTLEQRLNEASKTLYPHRNPQAYERTGDKRPVNALPEEMGRNSDQAKRERYEKANTSGEKRLVDKDVGSQKTAFNKKHQKIAAMTKDCPGYLEYKEAGVGPKFAELRQVDGAMMTILEAAASDNRHLTVDEASQISALKSHKMDLLKKKSQ